MRSHSKRKDVPFFKEETRGGWDSWSQERSVIVAVCLSDEDLGVGDTLTVDVHSAPFDIDVPSEVTEVSVELDFGSHIEFSEVHIESWEHDIDRRLDEREFRHAWGDWLSRP